jgi:hypothetical protein
MYIQQKRVKVGWKSMELVARSTKRVQIKRNWGSGHAQDGDEFETFW